MENVYLKEALSPGKRTSSSRNFSKATVQHKLKTRLALQNNPTPLEFKQATLNAYQLIALCLCNKLTPILTEGPQKGC